jgi:ABC-type amino acid transport substrate-binding protein
MNKSILPSQTVEVNSTVISKAQYEYYNSMLRLEFKNGKSYDYKPVPNHVFEGLRNSESKGKFINRYILPIYFYKLVD